MLLQSLKRAPFVVRPKQRKRSDHQPSSKILTGSPEGTAEINAYIAVRDMYLRDAEQKTTTASVERVERANEFVAQALTPARSPYEAQCLSESDAIRERRRCASVSLRLSALRDFIVRSSSAAHPQAV